MDSFNKHFPSRLPFFEVHCHERAFVFQVWLFCLVNLAQQRFGSSSPFFYQTFPFFHATQANARLRVSSSQLFSFPLPLPLSLPFPFLQKKRGDHTRKKKRGDCTGAFGNRSTTCQYRPLPELHTRYQFFKKKNEEEKKRAKLKRIFVPLSHLFTKVKHIYASLIFSTFLFFFSNIFVHSILTTEKENARA